MDRKVVNFSIIVLLIGVLMPTPGSRAFEVKTHEKLSLRALQSTTLDSYLREVLRLEFQDGVQQLFNGKVVRNWIEFGSKEEDDPWWRLQQHFHDPTKAWNQAGTLGISSVIWSQLLNQDNGVGGGNHSWKDARDSYFNALTSTNIDQLLTNINFVRVRGVDAEYEMSVIKSGVEYSYMVLFSIDEDGVWRIKFF